MTVTVRLEGKEVEQALRRISRTGVPRAASDLLNRVAFEVLDGLEEHTGDVFEFAGPATDKFLRRGFRFDKARPTGEPKATIFPRQVAGKIIEDHDAGGTITAADGERLGFDGKLAIPVNVKRGKRGRVSKRMKPSEVVKVGRRGFVNPSRTAILQRVSRKSRKVRVLYALVPKAKLKKTFEFRETVQRVATRELPRKADRILQKLGQ